jgi:hypothetical protein
MSHDLDRAGGKKVYETPRLATISLRPEEAVLGACKTASGAGGQHPTCNPFFAGCQNVGS